MRGSFGGNADTFLNVVGYTKTMKILMLLILTLTIAACKQNNQPTKEMMMKTLKYSAYYWHFNHNTDSSVFCLVHYIEIDSNGHYMISRDENCLESPKCFEGTINDKIRNLIDTTFYFDNYKTDYSWKWDDGTLYDGLTYCFDYKKVGSDRNRILFIPNKSPHKIKELGFLLDSLIYFTELKQSTFTIKNDKYKDDLMSLEVSINGKPPKIKFDTSRYIPFKVSTH